MSMTHMSWNYRNSKLIFNKTPSDILWVTYFPKLTILLTIKLLALKYLRLNHSLSYNDHVSSWKQTKKWLVRFVAYKMLNLKPRGDVALICFPTNFIYQEVLSRTSRRLERDHFPRRHTSRQEHDEILNQLPSK